MSVMTIPDYNNFEEKELFFKVKKIETLKEFNHLIEIHKNSQGIYRGVKMAKYKMYTTLQREIIKLNIYDVFDLNKYIENIRQDEKIIRWLEKKGIPNSKLSFLSLIQHYQGPTPFLDFTKDIDVAINFATLNYTEKELDQMNGYFSIFFIDRNDVEIIEIPSTFQKVISTITDVKTNFSSYKSEQKYLLFDHFLNAYQFEIFLLHPTIIDENLIEFVNSNNNTRIKAQNGLFIYNENCLDPLEVALRKYYSKTVTLEATFEEIYTGKYSPEHDAEMLKRNAMEDRLRQNIIQCFEIKKSLIPEIRSLLSLREENLKLEFFDDEQSGCSQSFLNREYFMNIFHNSITNNSL